MVSVCRRGIRSGWSETRFCIECIEAYLLNPRGICTRAGSAYNLGSEAEFAAKYPFLAVSADRAVFLEFALKFLMYQPCNKKEAIEKKAAETSAAAAQQGTFLELTRSSPLAPLVRVPAL